MEQNNNLNSNDNKYNNVGGGNDENDGNMAFDSRGGGFPGFPAKRSIAERRGFNSNAARINTARFRTNFTTTITPTKTSPLASLSSPLSAGRSPRLTIPPGISPTALLDSPIMLPNSQAMPSPTTGSLYWTYEPGNNSGVTSVSDSTDLSFKFKIHNDSNTIPPHSASLDQGGITDSQPLVQVSPQIDFSFIDGFSNGQTTKNIDSSFPADFSNGQTTKNIEPYSYNDVKMIDCPIVNANNVEVPTCQSDEASDDSFPMKKAINGEDNGQQPVLVEGDRKDTSLATGVARTSEDGYNWRKYGQKQVKGSEYPRSYYKCTQPSCQVKKKVERSYDGEITEIIYKGTHNHAKPHLSRLLSATADEMQDMGEASETYAKIEGGPVWRNIQAGVKDVKNSLDWKADGQERTPSNSVVTDLSDNSKPKSICMLESEDTPELSSALASHDGDEDVSTQALTALEDDAEDEESDSKRRKKDSYLVETPLPTRAAREPRVVVQIESEVDILDDGYRWRKYGQKVVKGNPNPRSYYKCTSAGCSVRKHVERASHNLKYVVTTYDGKHNHEVPTARNSNLISSSDGGLPPNGPNGSMSLSIPKREPLTSCFDRKPEFGSDLFRPSLVGSFGANMKFGSNPMCQMKYPSLNSTNISYASYGLNPDCCAAPHAGSISSMFPDYPMPLPLNHPSSGNIALAGLNFNGVKPMGPIQPYFSGQQVRDIDTGFLRPKQEQKDETIYGTFDHENSSLSSSSTTLSIYQRVMQNFPS